MAQANEIVETALEKVRNLKGLGDVHSIVFDGVMGELAIDGVVFDYIVVDNLNNANLDSCIDKLHGYGHNPQRLIITGSSSLKVRERALDYGASVLDASGNALICVHGKLYVNIQGLKAVKPKTDLSMSFKAQGLKVIFYLLTREDTVIPTMRVLSEESGASLGTVKNVMDILSSNGYVFESLKGKCLNNSLRLLEEWVTMYNQQQRAKNVIGRASFIKDKSGWESINLPEGMMWGGECGAYLHNGYLRPGAFCLYSSALVRNIVQTGAIVPNSTGDVVVYEKFWKGELSARGEALLFYADMVSTDDSRCFEAATKLKNEELRDK